MSCNLRTPLGSVHPADLEDTLEDRQPYSVFFARESKEETELTQSMGCRSGCTTQKNLHLPNMYDYMTATPQWLCS